MPQETDDAPWQVFAGVHVRVFTPPEQALHGPHVPVPVEETTTFTQRLQLFDSSNSLMTPALFLSVLSAQARTEYVAAVGKEYTLVVVFCAPKGSVVIVEEVRSVIVEAGLMSTPRLLPPFAT